MPVSDRDTLRRIRSLVIPPAWEDVWICAVPDGHLQAVGRDARGRRQYRYHQRFRARRDVEKFARLVRFGERLPRLRRRVEADLARPRLPKEKVLATVVRLLELTRFRIGNEEYARLNRSFGLSTLRDRHARIDGSRVRFRFKGKGGRPVDAELADRRLATIVRRCQELPGQALFQYVDDDGEPRPIASEDVNEYIREAMGDETMSAKDFRTWAATVLAHRALNAAMEDGAPRATKRAVVEAVKATAAEIGDTPAVTRNSYVHPAVIESYLDGDHTEHARPGSTRRRPPGAPPGRDEELEVIATLRKRASASAEPRIRRRVTVAQPPRASTDLADTVTEVVAAT